MTKFNVGDKVRITGDLYIRLIGKEGVITEDDGTSCAPYSVKLEDGSIQRKFGKYLALVTPSTPPAPKKSARIAALETQVAELQAKVEALEKAEKTAKEHDTLEPLYPLTSRFDRMVDVNVDRILADIERKAKPTLEALLATYPAVQPTPNEQRADVIKRAKAFVGEGFDGWYGNRLCNAEFLVNSDKRTAVALLRWKRNNSVVAKGIAKCDQSDVFNADIGKAIALARALGVEVPTEFVKAVQPTEVVVGHIVKDKEGGKFAWDDYKVARTDVKNGEIRAFTQDGMFARQRYLTITDDTDAVYE